MRNKMKEISLYFVCNNNDIAYSCLVDETQAHVNTSKLFFNFTGELDPERMGSGIQYGNTQLRKTTQTKPENGDKCDC